MNRNLREVRDLALRLREHEGNDPEVGGYLEKSRQPARLEPGLKDLALFYRAWNDPMGCLQRLSIVIKV